MFILNYYYPTQLPGSDCDDVGVSPTWTIADYEHTIVSIAPNAVFNPPALAENERHFVKMMRGSVIDINYDGIFINGHWETFVATIPNRAIPFRIDSSVTDIKAGANGAVIMYMKVAEEALLVPITSMTEAPTTNIAGPFAEKLFWTKFGDYYASFATKQFWNLAGILIQDSDENRVCNIQWWTLREDSDADGYHNHGGMTSDNTFGELHMALYTGNQISGMQTSLPKTKNLNYVPTPVDGTMITVYFVIPSLSIVLSVLKLCVCFSFWFLLLLHCSIDALI